MLAELQGGDIVPSVSSDAQSADNIEERDAIRDRRRIWREKTIGYVLDSALGKDEKDMFQMHRYCIQGNTYIKFCDGVSYVKPFSFTMNNMDQIYLGLRLTSLA